MLEPVPGACAPGYIPLPLRGYIIIDMLHRLLLVSMFPAILAATAFAFQEGVPQFPPIKNSQNPKDTPPTPEEAVKRMTLPPGFEVTLFAGEPNVHQPIAMTFDDRGRLWVAECYTYAAKSYEKSWDPRARDRILIFEDTDNDGKFDKRTVFWDQAQNLTSIAYGFGGIWALCAPKLLFIPIKDDKPGEPQVVLDGWAVDGVGHNIVNGLLWGPDGWLYGRHGIMFTSNVGPPGTPESKRTKLNCSIWRYHPTRKTFEVVTNGTTNPWGMDYDDYGQMFFTNSVNGHLWHVIPGAHYKRMYGEDFNPHVYELLDMHADHFHWDEKEGWQKSRDQSGEHSKRGGGHAHCGGMIYLGDNFPIKYRNTIFMGNLHGNRINNDRPVRHGSGYVAKHEADFLLGNNPWLRPVDLKMGPDGGVYISDWVDLGECHDHDGVHRTSGRIYKVTYGKAKKPEIADVAELGDEQLLKLQIDSRNEFYVRAARRILQERAASKQLGRNTLAELPELLQNTFLPDMRRDLRALWALHVAGETNEQILNLWLTDRNEHVRAWAIRLLVDAESPKRATIDSFVRLARSDKSGLVRLFLASALQRLPVKDRPRLAAALLAHDDSEDHNLPLMIWYGIEPSVASSTAAALMLAEETKIKKVRRFIARRLTYEIDRNVTGLDDLLRLTMKQDASFQLDVVRGMSDALRGRRKATPPPVWAEFEKVASASTWTGVKETARELSVVFGDGRALDELWKIAQSSQADPPARRAALETLVEVRPEGLLPVLHKLVSDRATVALAARGLASYDHPKTPSLLLKHYNLLKLEDRPEAINTLVSRSQYARELLKAVADDKIARSDVSAFHARQIQGFNDAALNAELSKVWGEIRTTPAEKKELITRYKSLLTPERLQKANASSGRALYNQACATCHLLYGQGKLIGPDITGSDRHNLDYLLENIVDPSALVPAEFRMSVITLKNGRVLNGLVSEQTEKTLAVQTQTEKIRLDRADVDEIRATPVSFMPDGLLAPLSEAQIADLIAYLKGREQVALPK